MITLILHRLPDLLMVVVSAWLGLGLLVRAPHNRVIQAFAIFCVHMVLYGITSIQYQLTTSQSVALILGRAELVATVLAPASFVLFIAVLSTSGQVQRGALLLVGLFSVTGVALALYAVFGDMPSFEKVVTSWTRWEEPRFPDGWLKWMSAAQRTVPLLVALVLMWMSFWRRLGDSYDLKMRRILMLTALLGVIGAVTATAARELSWSPALPRTLIVLAMLVFTYTVLTTRGLLPARATQRAFIYSVVGSLFTMGYIGLVMLLEWAAGELLHINIPLVSALSIVGLAAAFGPVGEWVRSQMDRRFYPREFDYSQLLKSLSDELFERGDLHEQLHAALSWICRTLDVQAGMVVVVTHEGLVPWAIYGDEDVPPLLQDISLPDELLELDDNWGAWPCASLLLPLKRGEDTVGTLALGRRELEHSEEQTYSDTERALLNHLGSYLALSIVHAQVREEHRGLMVTLNEQRKTLQQQQEQLAMRAVEAVQQASKAEEKSQVAGLKVHALGSLRVERGDGEVITRWGGDKAGTYQAEALFAFLFDRRGKGISKDEAEEVIWPDLEISKADSAFHRTLAALRRTLEPGLRRGNQSRLITYHHERYWLEEEAIAWCDVEEFLSEVERGFTLFHQHDYDNALRLLESANQRYRGDYMDDCPFFGDSFYVEDQRQPLRTRYVELQVMLGSLYEQQKRVGEAASAYRHALALSIDGCSPAEEGLSRLQENLTA